MRRHIRLILFVIMSMVSVMALTGVATAAPSSQDSRYATPVVVVNTSFLNIRTGPGVQYSVLITVVGGTTLPVLGIAPDGVWFQVSTQAGVGWLNSQYGLPRGNFQYVPVVQPPTITQPAVNPSFTGGAGAADDGATDVGFSSGRLWGLSVVVGHDLRTTAGIAGKSIGFLDGNNGVIYPVTNAAFVDGVAWVQIAVADLGPVWVEQSKSIFRPYGCGFSVVQMTQDRELAVGPDGTGGDKDKSIAAGQEAYLLDIKGGLYKIELMSGGIGWVDEMGITIRDESKTTKPNCVSAATVAAEGTGGSGENGGATSAAQPALAGAHVIVNTGHLNIRSGAGAQFNSVASVPGGTRLTALGFAPDGVWILVGGTFGRGWVNGDYILFRGDASSLPVVRETGGETALPVAQLTRTITLYAAPNLTLGVVGTLNAPGEYTVVGRTADSLWVQLTTPVGLGWVQADFVIVKGNTALIPVIGS